MSQTSPTWKGYQKPGGSKFHAPIPFSQGAHTDCPVCKFGTVYGNGCIDCGHGRRQKEPAGHQPKSG